MKTRSRSLWGLLVLVLLASLTLSPVKTQAASDAWSLVDCPNPSSTDNVLYATSAAATNAVWAVGYYDPTTYGPDTTLIDFWNGNYCVKQTSQDPGSNGNQLSGVYAFATNDAWAVGYQDNGMGHRALTEHWDGSVWNYVESPNATVGTEVYPTTLLAVSGEAAHGSFEQEVWAVGYYDDGTSHIPWTEVWRSSFGWQPISLPQPVPSGELNSVYSVYNPAVYHYDTFAAGETRGTTQPLIYHWDDSTWHLDYSGPDPGSSHFLSGVEASAYNTGWAVGSYYDGTVRRPLFERMERGTWANYPGPTSGVNTLLNATAPVDSNYVWAVGQLDPGGGGVIQSLAMRWAGGSWKIVPSQNVGNYLNTLRGVSVVPGTSVAGGGDIWAVGDYEYTNGNMYTLVETYHMPAGVRPPP